MFKKIFWLALLPVSFLGCTQPSSGAKNKPNQDRIRVGIFDTNDDSPGCITDAYEALRIDAQMDPQIIGAATIMSDAILDYDLILFPGGSGKAQTIKLGQLGMKRVQELVTIHGKGVMGICAGSYVLSQTQGYPSLDLSGFEAIDIEHDHRGHGLVKFSLTDAGKKVFPELQGRELSYSKYYEGPVLTVPDQPNYTGISLSTMWSDVHTVEGTPANMTNNRPFITATQAGKGRVVTFVGHPENTPGMRWMIPRMVRWALDKELVSYSDAVVRPQIYQEEILFTTGRLQQQDRYDQMLWGTPEEKEEAIRQLVETSAWSAKKKVIGLIRDDNAGVRVTAARTIVELERTDALHDLEIAAATESDEAVRNEMNRLLTQLKQMVGCSMD